MGAVVSWAQPWQKGGLGHVNMKEEKDSIAAMKRWGFEIDEEATKKLRASASIKHFQKSTVVYRVNKKLRL